ncbi:hypothetical protein CEE44_03025 [Candidatus Woesearchaeota archaeon B3_Woes]|nr:MAG: hypothetical protein CEE44_03025 [Candidatus Woesearchaeota archaeon B3_Woes]
MRVEMNKVRNGRVIIDGKLRDIMLPERNSYVFDFSRYKNIMSYPRPNEDGVEKIICSDSKSPLLDIGSIWDKEENKLWERLVGFETSSNNDDATNEYTLISKDFDILKGVDLVQAHPDLDEILSQLGVNSLAAFYSPNDFGLESTGEKVPVEVQRMKWTTGRTATLEQPILINDELYLLEVKGVNYGDMPLDLINGFRGGRECNGGMTKTRMEHSVEMLNHLNANSYDSVILICAYEIPQLHQFNGESLGAYVRAVKSSPSVSHYHEDLPDVAEALNMSKEDLAEYIIRGATRDLAIMWKAGITHLGPIHEQNIRLGSITDFTGSQYVKDSGFNGVVEDTVSFVASSQNIMRMLLGSKGEWPSRDLYDTNLKEAIRLESIAEEKEIEGQAEHYCRAREIITSELNQQLGLNLPSVVGTITLAAEIYDMQRQLGLTNPNEETHIEHLQYNGWERILTPITIDTLKVQE